MIEKKKLELEAELNSITERIDLLKSWRNPAPPQVQYKVTQRIAELEKKADALDEKIYQMEISR